MEDLCEQGYDIIRGRSLTIEELKAVLLKLAKLHAVSYKLGHDELQSDLVTKYQKGIFSTDDFCDHDFFAEGPKKFSKLLNSHCDLNKYAEKFESVREELMETVKKLYRAYSMNVKNVIYVLNHGDFHAKNMMFKIGTNGQFEDIIMVDFQFSVYAPSNLDITNALFMMFSPEHRLEKRDELTQYYFENFIETLKMIEFEGELPKYSDYKINELKYRHHGKQKCS